MIRNRSYHARARRISGLFSAAAILERPVPRRRKKHGDQLQGQQLELTFSEPPPAEPPDPDRPLADLFPEA